MIVWGVLWLAVAIIAPVGSAFAKPIPFIVVSIYALVSAATEFLGVRTGDVISFPRRPLPGIPFFTLWRQRLVTGEIERVTSAPKSFGFEPVILSTGAGVRELLYFPNRDAKRRFFRQVQEVNPGIEIYRSGS